MKHSREELERWLVALIADLVGADPKVIAVKARFDEHGVDSAAAVGVTAELERFLGRDLEPTLLYDYPTIASLAEHLAND